MSKPTSPLRGERSTDSSPSQKQATRPLQPLKPLRRGLLRAAASVATLGPGGWAATVLGLSGLHSALARARPSDPAAAQAPASAPAGGRPSPASAPVGAAEAAVNYPAVVPGYRMQFPRDHGAHPAFRTEWWYLTGWLEQGGGEPIGFQVTFFRSRPGVAEALPVPSAARQLIIAHVAVSSPALARLTHDQRVARAAFGLAAASEGQMAVRLDDWRLEMDEHKRIQVRIAAREFTLELELQGGGPALLQGEAGFSRKGPAPAQASYYYSLPNLQVSGRVALGSAAARPVRGQAWFDHEWSSDYLAGQAVGWDWIGINLATGAALMAFRIRGAAGASVWAGATVRHADGREDRHGPSEVVFEPIGQWQSPRSGIRYPVRMRVTVARIAWELRPLMDDQELDDRVGVGTAYWEGAVVAWSGQQRVGRGYLELTGYAGRVEM